MRRLLAAYLGTTAAAVVLADDAHGRPELEGAQRGQLHFNWSHSGSRALVAVALGVQPGIDLEDRRRRARRDVLALARRFFAPQEAAALSNLPTEARALAFLRLWTSKEALLKAHGSGLAYGLHRVVLDLRDTGVALAEFEGESVPAWKLQELALYPDWVAALAWRGPPMHVRWCGEAR